jgi:hypothetical protein
VLWLRKMAFLSFCVLLGMGYEDKLREARLLGFQAKEKW